ACSRRDLSRPVRITSAPSARARRAVSSPMPALPPITTTVCPSSSGSRVVALNGCAPIGSPVGGDLVAERRQRVGVDLGEGGKRLDRVAEHVERYMGADGQGGLLEPLAGLRSERIRTRQPLAV